jgi:hypothetical protein
MPFDDHLPMEQEIWPSSYNLHYTARLRAHYVSMVWLTLPMR